MLSVIIPVLDEAQSLPQLVRELDQVAIERGYELQISDFDGIPDDVIDAEVAWIAQGNSSSLVFQLGERIANSGR